jgi:hypothetical protein
MTNEIKTVYLTQEQFEKDLEVCLTILKEPTKNHKYYVCEYISQALYKSIFNIVILN